MKNWFDCLCTIREGNQTCLCPFSVCKNVVTIYPVLCILNFLLCRFFFCLGNWKRVRRKKFPLHRKNRDLFFWKFYVVRCLFDPGVLRQNNARIFYGC